ncbi:AraC family transcriptional regulator (plasmid) [Rhodococcus sp. USK10]|uniref:AraC family transcriptional regulator n=1 Tax=Rhodococcus sp. USK10 TaxID=2789739 RepID=UPI001C5EF470|nr:AraC family transcriptional regulator [Rhodococcus sp. USK10]QYB00099.1 AraC family transcriptional regulator [Rhodococcus sp. USK10]
MDPEQAEAAISEAYSPATLNIRGPLDDFVLRMRLTELPGLSLGHIEFGVDVAVAAPPPSIYVVCFARQGTIDVRSGSNHQVVSGAHGAVVDPQRVTYFENWRPGSELVSLRIEREALEDRLTVMTGRAPTEPIQFRLGLDTTDPQATSLVRSLRLLEAESVCPGGLSADPVAASVLTDMVATSLLMCQPNNYSESLRARGKPVPPHIIRQAIELVEVNPMAVNTVVEWATTVHISVRSLEEGFQRYLDTTPMAHLRQVRLDRAHAELVTSDARERTVSGIARRWGFNHLGRFSSAHRTRYGVLPSETLHRPAGSPLIKTD